MCVWGSQVTYPNSVRVHYPQLAGDLDLLEELNPPTLDKRDRYLNLGSWLRDCVAKGLIRLGEMELLRSAIAPYM